MNQRDRARGVIQNRVDQEAAVAGDIVLPVLAIVRAATVAPRRQNTPAPEMESDEAQVYGQHL